MGHARQWRRENKQRFGKLNRRRGKKATQGKNRHHLTPRSRGGSMADSNLLDIRIPRHNALHHRFGVMTIEEIRDELRFIFAVPETVEQPELFVPDFIDRLCRMKHR